MLLRHAISLLVIAACNSQAPTASSPPSAPAPPASSSAKTAHNEDAAILQAVIDAPGLQPYYHAEVRPERKPLVLLEGPHTKGAALEKFGAPVEIVPADRIGDRPHLAIQSL